MSTQHWNELVPEKNRLLSPNQNARRLGGAMPTHVAIHVTGTDSLAAVKNTFLASNSVSAHYLIAKDGAIYQFVPDHKRAWHAGIDSTSRALYRKGRATWARYLKYFSWYTSYPDAALFVDGDLRPVWDKTEATFVTQGENVPWEQFEYFEKRWGTLEYPVNFESDPDPNNYSIGIEILGFGSRKPDIRAYSGEMYESLNRLLENLAEKYEIPLEKGRVIGHEDVHPVARFGWDPAPGFEWESIL